MLSFTVGPGMISRESGCGQVMSVINRMHCIDIVSEAR